ncbi:MAG: hypothetical protein KAJ73_00770 [Zetaproteobacteria bacterium]|nr:hypothetical protein [Zetaproteobacteria bacterium]
MKDCPTFGGCGSEGTLKPTGRGREGWDLWQCEKCSEYSWVKEKVKINMANNMSITRLNLLHNGANPHDIRADAEVTGDVGLYNELRMGAYGPDGECIADVLMGLDEHGELRVLITTDGKGEEDHNIAVYPLRDVNQAIQLG